MFWKTYLISYAFKRPDGQTGTGRIVRKLPRNKVKIFDNLETEIRKNGDFEQIAITNIVRLN